MADNTQSLDPSTSSNEEVIEDPDLDFKIYTTTKFICSVEPSFDALFLNTI